jgi:hypothetical protein
MRRKIPKGGRLPPPPQNHDVDLAPFRTIRIGRHPTKKEMQELKDSRNVLREIRAPSGWWLQACYTSTLPQGLAFMAEMDISYQGWFPQWYSGWDRRGFGGSRDRSFYGWIVGSWGGGGIPPDLSSLSTWLESRNEVANFFQSFPRPFLSLLSGKSASSAFPGVYWMNDSADLDLKPRLQNLKYSIQWDKPLEGVTTT